ncbi:MAG: hypothetical protein AMJ61_06040 [Desulfobacterales bacterium SG8_35_2]|jgi:hypothetical protein|nr:MAG: hypothetical protein AMJ61_06040 [Desulfobacterales bacterium SG8_35_2]
MMRPFLFGEKEKPASGGDGNGLPRRRYGALGNDLSLALYGSVRSMVLGGLDGDLSLDGIKAVISAKGPLRGCRKYFL